RLRGRHRPRPRDHERGHRRLRLEQEAPLDSEGGFAPLPTLRARLRLACRCLPPGQDCAGKARARTESNLVGGWFVGDVKDPRRAGDCPPPVRRRPICDEGGASMLFPTTLVGSWPQPEWLIDRGRLAGRFPPRVRARELWRPAPEHLARAQDDATLLAIRAQEDAGLDILTDGE